ncbi:hypothetical protein LTR37_020103 [Vermiconidia calcicola]|uniref:Uncharacterized protein n=1 Tax=Vermiconidia calcicola TaxID=1690605 RepID=A0ACC3ME41_9PEZI|nr:hypothetical protein LTR37_020103 [Vermiconidia calcicola]
MPNYNQWKVAKLAKTTHDRGLDAALAENCKNRRPVKKNYVDVLRQADQNIPQADQSDGFILMNKLPTELKDMIYEDLLLFHGSTTCHPQILATCREANKEASSILYKKNVVEVEISDDSVQAHGGRCGDHDPSSHIRETSNITALQWPDYLRRVGQIRISVEQGQAPTRAWPAWHPRNVSAWPPASARGTHPTTVSQVFYSLCSFLEDSHAVRSLELDLRSLTTTSDDTKMIDGFEYTFTMLRPGVTLYLKTNEPGHGVPVETAPRKQHRGSALTPALKPLATIARFRALKEPIAPIEGSRRPTPGLNDTPLAKARALGRNLGGQARDEFGPGRFFDRKWEGRARDATVELKRQLKDLGQDDSLVFGNAYDFVISRLQHQRYALKRTQ